MIQDLNLIFCELASLLALATTAQGLAKPKVLNNLDRIADYISAMLRGEVSFLRALRTDSSVDMTLKLAPQATTASKPVGSTLTASAYSALLPTVWSLLCHSATAPPPSADQSPPSVDPILEALLDHFASLGPNSESKSLGFIFIARICLVRTLHSLTVRACCSLLGCSKRWTTTQAALVESERDPSLQQVETS